MELKQGGEALAQSLVLGAVKGSPCSPGCLCLVGGPLGAIWLPDALPHGVIPSLFSAEPLPPSGVSLSSQESPHSLLASWEEAMGEGYLLALSTMEDPMKNRSLLRGATNFTYEGLSPGTLYTFEVSTVAGPYTSSPQRITNWTCECRSPHRSQPQDSLPCDVVPQGCASMGLLQLRAIKG